MENHLTNESIRKKHQNQFELINYAIHLAKNMIHSGRDPRVKIASQSKALQILAEIEQGKDMLDDIPSQSIEATGKYSTASTATFEEEN